MIDPTARIVPSAIVDDGATVGADTRVWHFVHVMAGARIGRQCSLGQNVFVASGAVIGDGVRVQNNVSIFRGVTLENDVFVGPSAVFTNVDRPRAHTPTDPELYAATRVRTGATIGANATIRCGVEIGAHAFVAAGSVVTKSVPAHALVAGVPAEQRAWVCICGTSGPVHQAPSVRTPPPEIGRKRSASGHPEHRRAWACACGRRWHVTDDGMLMDDAT